MPVILSSLPFETGGMTNQTITKLIQMTTSPKQTKKQNQSNLTEKLKIYLQFLYVNLMFNPLGRIMVG